ncbi:hypothetical protein ACFL46_05495 [Candidatus Neomarinimicrobiota bacterium]
MEKRHLTQIILMVVGIIYISFSAQSCDKGKESIKDNKVKPDKIVGVKEKGKEYSKVVRVIMEMDSGTTSYVHEGDKEIAVPVFEYDPRKEIATALKKATFKAVSSKSEKYDLTLRITHRERVRRSSGSQYDLSTETVIDHIGFVLEDKDSVVLIEDERGPFSSYASKAYAKQDFVNDLVALVEIRIEKPDETTSWIEFVSRRGDNASEKAIVKAGDPTYSVRDKQLIILKPLLRSHKISSRVVSERLLRTLEYMPSSYMDRAVLSIIQTYPFHRWSARGGEMTADAWAARQGVISVIKHETTAIDLFLEDLTGKQELNFFRYGVRDGGVATRAKTVLMRLSKGRWTKFDYDKFASIGNSVKIIDRNSEFDFFQVKYFDYNQTLLGEVEVVNPKRASEIYSKLWNQEWNNYTINKLIEILKNGRNTNIDKDALKNIGIDNNNYFQDIIEILGEISNDQAIPVLNTYLDHPILADSAKKAIESIEARGI